MSAKPTTMPIRPLPPEVSARIDEVVANFNKALKDCLTEALRFHGMEVIDAVMDILDERGGPVAVEEMAVALRRGGIGMSVAESAAHGGAGGDLKRSISFYTSRQLKIKEINGMIGRTEWPKAKFTVKPTDASKE